MTDQQTVPANATVTDCCTLFAFNIYIQVIKSYIYSILKKNIILLREQKTVCLINRNWETIKYGLLRQTFLVN